MTDESRPLSRRERRAQEARAAARPADDTDALSDAPISESIPTHSPEGRVLTRRERRRLERSRQPMETWTAEEEMIATGQIPTMTPERIAEQERIAREKAEQAQREAEQHSAPSIVAPPAAEGDASEERADSVAAEHEEADAAPALVLEPEPAEEAEPEPELPAEPAVGAWQPYDPQLGPTREAATEPSLEPAHEESPPTIPQRTSLIPPALDEPPEDRAAAEPAAVEPDTAEPDEEPQEPVPSVLGMPPGMSPDMFAALFPPGSLQRKLMEQQATDQAAEPVDPAPAEDPADEIRRLTQQAVADIESASTRLSVSSPDNDEPAARAAAEAVLPNAWGPAAETTASAHEPSSPSEQVAPSAHSAPSSNSAPSNNSAPSARSAPGAVQLAPSSAPSAPNDWSADQAQQRGDEQPHWGDRTQAQPDDSAVSIDQAPFDAILGHHPGTAALDEASTASAELHRPAFHAVANPQREEGAQAPVADASDQLAPHTSAFDVPRWSTTTTDDANSPWAAHPLMKVDREAPVLPEVAPAQDIPQPDLSSVRRPAFAPQTDGFPSIEPVPTGQIEVPPRERPDLDDEAGPRHFKWAHLAVFGAVAFLLGVVVWNVAVRP